MRCDGTTPPAALDDACQAPLRSEFTAIQTPYRSERIQYCTVLIHLESGGALRRTETWFASPILYLLQAGIVRLSEG